jgi:hypothetical protein
MSDPKWVIEVRKEIQRLNRKLARLAKKQDSDEMTGDDWDDESNWSGWRDALKWALKMRAGKATRKDAWGRIRP